MLALALIISVCYITVIVVVVFFGLNREGKRRQKRLKNEKEKKKKLNVVYLLKAKEAALLCWAARKSSLTVLGSNVYWFNSEGDGGKEPGQRAPRESFSLATSLMCKVCDLFHLCAT